MSPLGLLVLTSLGIAGLATRWPGSAPADAPGGEDYAWCSCAS